MKLLKLLAVILAVTLMTAIITSVPAVRSTSVTNPTPAVVTVPAGD